VLAEHTTEPALGNAEQTPDVRNARAMAGSW
jgi:hypothetical protein